MIAADSRLRREKVWVGIVIHHTGLPVETPRDSSAWAKFFESMKSWLTRKDEAYLSAHFLIGRDGTIAQLVDPATHEAFHAGVSELWHPLKRQPAADWNRYAIGIELLGDGNREAYSDEQYGALARLCRDLMDKYPTIHPRAICGHEELAPGRKSDPGLLFNWRRFFGLLFREA